MDIGNSDMILKLNTKCCLDGQREIFQFYETLIIILFINKKNCNTLYIAAWQSATYTLSQASFTSSFHNQFHITLASNVTLTSKAHSYQFSSRFCKECIDKVLMWFNLMEIIGRFFSIYY
jgi:hypothetical protein